MSAPTGGYQDIPEEDRKKAVRFFDYARTTADQGNFDYAIELFINGLSLDPEDVEAHQALRDVSLKRKASGGKKMGMFEAMKLKKGDDRQNMLNAEKLLAYDPGNTDHMQGLLQSAFKAGFYDTVLWIGPIFQRANADSPKPDFNKYIVLKDTYKMLAAETGRADIWKLASDACQYATALRPDEMDLQNEAKNLSARYTMSAGNYEKGGSFRGSIRDMKGQQKLIDQDRDIRSDDAMSRIIKDAEDEWRSDPEEPGKLMRYVDALVKSETPDNENRAIEVLNDAFDRTRQFRFRLQIGSIKIRQLARMERSMRAAVAQSPADAKLRAEYKQFLRDRAEEELREYTLAAENYPTDLRYRYEMAKRMFELERFAEAIPMFQQARNDPKLRGDATLLLGRAFLDAGFTDEAVDTLNGLIQDYQIKGDARSIEMTYWYGRAQEERKDIQSALKAYSQVAQWEFNFRDVQARIKRLRAG